MNCEKCHLLKHIHVYSTIVSIRVFIIHACICKYFSIWIIFMNLYMHCASKVFVEFIKLFLLVISIARRNFLNIFATCNTKPFKPKEINV